MFARHPRGFGLFVLLVMSWASVWCCCVTPAEANGAAASRPCCRVVVTCPRDAGPAHDRSAADCPLMRVRETSIALASVALPTPDLTAALPTWLSVTPCGQPIVTESAARFRVAGPPGPPTLLALHTSLVC